MFIPGIFWGGTPTKKTYTPQTAAELCALNLFFGRDNKLQIYHGNFLMDNKRRKKMKQSKGCRFVPKMHQNTFGGRASHGPAGGAYALPQAS